MKLDTTSGIFNQTINSSKIDGYGYNGSLYLLSSVDKLLDIQISDLAGRIVFSEPYVKLIGNELKITPTDLSGIHLAVITDILGNEQILKVSF